MKYKLKYIILSALILAQFLVIGCKQSSYVAPILPVHDFFKNPDVEKFKLSPDGSYFSYLHSINSRQNIFIRPIDGNDTTQITFSKKRDIRYYFWANPQKIVYLKDDDGNGTYDVFSVDIDKKDEKQLTFAENSDIWIINELRNDPDHILININKANPREFDVYKLNINTGNLTLDTKNPGNVTHWLADNNGIVRIAIKTDGVNSTLLYRKDKNHHFKSILTNNFKNEFRPITFTNDNKFIYAISNIDKDKSELVEFDPDKIEIRKVLYKNPNVDAENIKIFGKNNRLVAVSFSTWKKEFYFFDKEYENLHIKLKQKLPNSIIEISNTDDSETKLLVKVSSDKSPGTYYYFNSVKDKLIKLAETNPWITEKNLSNMKPISYKSRDGKTIHGYLTFPKGKEKSLNQPVVVYPHGGPWLRNNWEFNRTVQFLANRGYVVLQMNYRGSSGYGKEFFQAGFKEWGGKIQNDITDGVNWLIRQNIADKKRIGIFGFSFGGFSALSALSDNPKLYSCGIDYSGIADLHSFLNSIPTQWKPFRKMIYEMVGNPKTDSLMLFSHSPINKIKNIRVPLLVVQGAKDRKSDKKETDKLVKVLRAQKIQVEYIVKENEGHSFRNEENRLYLYKRIENFLANNLKGRKYDN